MESLITQEEVEQLLAQIVVQEREVRQRTFLSRPTPTALHNIFFAGEEGYELSDIGYLRTFPQYARNNERTDSIAKEVGDVLSQIATTLIALDAEGPPANTTHGAEYWLAWMHLCIANAEFSLVLGQRSTCRQCIQRAAHAAWQVSLILGVDPLDAVQLVHAKVLAKHGPRHLAVLAAKAAADAANGTSGELSPRKHEAGCQCCNCVGCLECNRADWGD